MLADAREPTQGPRRDDAVGREEDDRMRIEQRCFDETPTAIGRRRGGIVGLATDRRFAVTADRLGELAIYRVQGELDRLLANIVSTGAIGRLLNLATFNEEIANKIEGPLVGPPSWPG